MSTKIYGGIRIPRNKLAEFNFWFDEWCIDRAVAMTRSMMHVKPNIIDQMIKDAKGFHHHKSVKELLVDKDVRMWCEVEFVMRYFLACSMRHTHGSLDCWYNLFIPKDSRHFLINVGLPDHIVPKYPDYVEEYCYYNNSDRPDGITNAAWRRRERDWEAACDPVLEDSSKLTHIVIEGEHWKAVGYDRVCERILGKSWVWEKFHSPVFVAKHHVREEKEAKRKEMEKAAKKA